MPKLPRPYDVLDLVDGEELTTRVTGLAEGDVDIILKNGLPKTVGAIRLLVPAEDKPTVPYYWDLTSVLLQAHLRELAPQAIQSGRYLRLHKYGEGKIARFGVALLPADFHGPAHIGAHR